MIGSWSGRVWSGRISSGRVLVVSGVIGFIVART